MSENSNSFTPTPFDPSDPAQFTPTQGNYRELKPFRFWCQKVLPLVYDDSLSYYELLCKVVDYLNKTMEDVDTLHTDVDNMYDAYDELQTDYNAKYAGMTEWINQSYQALVDFVNTYFEELDVQEEINNKLDEMAEDGTLTTLIGYYINPIAEVQNNRISVLEARMDTFASLPDGSTAGDAEMLDARIGANGITYNSVGDAIRAQITNINNSEKTQADVVNTLFGYEEAVTPSETLTGQLYVYSNNTFITVANSSVKKIVVDNTKLAYFVSTVAYAGTASALVNYFDSSDLLIGYEFRMKSTATSIENQILTLPPNTAYFLVNLRGVSSSIYAISGDAKTVKSLATELLNGRIDNYNVSYNSIGDAIRGQIQNITNIDKVQADVDNSLFGYEKEITPDHVYNGQIYVYSTNSFLNLANSSAKKIIIDNTKKAYFVSTSGYAGVASAFVNYFNSNDEFIGYEYRIKNASYSITNQILNIPANTSYFIVNLRGASSHIYAIDNSVLTVNEISNIVKSNKNNITVLQKGCDLGTEIAPNEITENTLYQYSTNREVEVSGCTLKKYNIDANVLAYFGDTSLYAGSTGFPLISYFDSSDNQLGYEYMNEAGNVHASIKQVMLNIPENTSYMLVNSRGYNSIIKAFKETDTVQKNQRAISILFVGNSMTQDAIAYLPYLLKTYFPEIYFNIYIWYNAGKTLEEQYELFTSNTPCQIFSIANNKSKWDNHNNAYNMNYVCQNFKFDVVCMQEYFNYKQTYTDADITVWNNCRDYICSHYTGGNPLEFISLFHAPRRNALETAYTVTMDGNKKILQDTIAQDMIPCGIATYLALQTSIGTLGDGGDLTPGDYTHAQEGVPCLIQTYTALCWLLDKLGCFKSVYNCPLRMTTDIYNSINVPGPNLGSGVITGTDSQNLIAQDVAIMAFKEGKSIVNANIYVQ